MLKHILIAPIAIVFWVFVVTFAADFWMRLVHTIAGLFL